MGGVSWELKDTSIAWEGSRVHGGKVNDKSFTRSALNFKVWLGKLAAPGAEQRGAGVRHLPHCFSGLLLQIYRNIV